MKKVMHMDNIKKFTNFSQHNPSAYHNPGTYITNIMISKIIIL